MTRRAGVALPIVPVVGFVSAFALAPALYVIARALLAAGPGGVGVALGDPLNRLAIENSLVQGGLSAAASVAAGYPLGVLLGRYEWPGRRFVRSVLVVPFLLPTLVVVLGIEDLFGGAGVLSGLWPALAWFGSGIPGIIAVNVAFNAPLVGLLVAAAIESAPQELEEVVATLGGSPFAQYRFGWGPASWRAAAAGGLLAFVFSALAFASPLLLCGPRCYTLEARVWSLAQILLDPTTAAVLAGAMTVVMLGPLAAYLFLAGGSRSAGPRRPFSARRLRGRSVTSWATLGLGGGVVGLLALLLGTILLRGARAAAPGGAPGSAWGSLLSATTTRELGVPVAGAALNSVIFAALAATIALLLAVLSGYPYGVGGRRALRGALFLPLLISPVLLSFAVSSTYRPWVASAGAGWLLIVLSQATLALPFSAQGLESALRALPAGTRESLETLGARRFLAYLEADLPRVRPAFLAAGLFAFALGLGEFTATYFLATPSLTTLPVAIYRLEGLRASGLADALSALLVGASVVVFAAVQRVGGRVLA